MRIHRLLLRVQIVVPILCQTCTSIPVNGAANSFLEKQSEGVDQYFLKIMLSWTSLSFLPDVESLITCQRKPLFCRSVFPIIKLKGTESQKGYLCERHVFYCKRPALLMLEQNGVFSLTLLRMYHHCLKDTIRQTTSNLFPQNHINENWSEVCYIPNC